ncbi:hypothetical protein FRB99_004084 [Tulasnella sp. 403]|nr:hypothetical protein FRB99_004084 [Tulasnella sp. 403]
MSRNHQNLYVPPHRRAPSSDGATATGSCLPDWVSPLEHELFSRSPTFRHWLLVRQRLRHQVTEHLGDEPDNTAKEKPATYYRNKYYEAIDDINHSVNDTLRGKHRFLDLGCAPGGFSKWLLEMNPTAHGVGVTLGEEDHGLPMNFTRWDDNDTNRYTFIEGNIKDSTTWQAIADSLPSTGVCDLVVADTRYRDATTTPRVLHDPTHGEKLPPERSHTAKAVHASQLMLALRHLVGGGTLVTVIPSDTRPLAIAQLLLLRHLFERVTPTRYMGMWVQNAYYLVCEGYRSGEAEKEGIIQRLLAAFSGDAEDNVIDLKRIMMPQEVACDSNEGGVTEETVQWLLEHYEPIWRDQTGAMEKQLRWLQGKQYFVRGARRNKSGWD